MNMMDEGQPWQERENAMGDATAAPLMKNGRFFAIFFSAMDGAVGEETMHYFGMGWTTAEANKAMRKIGAKEKMRAMQIQLGGNHLDEAPAELMRMPRLQALWLGDNQIRHLGWITLMRSLILIDLSDNQLESHVASGHLEARQLEAALAEQQ